MGRARLSFRDLIKEGQEDVDLYFDLKYKAEIVGKINVVTTWHPESTVEVKTPDPESTDEVKTPEKMPIIDEKVGIPDDDQPKSTR